MQSEYLLMLDTKILFSIPSLAKGRWAWYYILRWVWFYILRKSHWAALSCVSCFNFICSDPVWLLWHCNVGTSEREKIACRSHENWNNLSKDFDELHEIFTMFTPPYQEVVEEQGWCQSTAGSSPPEPPHFAPGNNKTSRKKDIASWANVWVSYEPAHFLPSNNKKK